MLDSLWDRLLATAQAHAPDASLEAWLRACQLAALDGDHVRIRVPNKHARDWLLQNHLDWLESAARQVLGGNPRVSLEVERRAAPPPPMPRVPRDTSAALSTGLGSRYTFDTFVVGNSNQFAQAACLAVADLPSKAYNPLYIYGGVGLGKTHLLHAVGHQFARLYPTLRLLYISTERFTNELINAIRFDRTAEFRSKYRNIDLLLIDDIHF